MVSLKACGKWPVARLCCANVKMWCSSVDRQRFRIWLGISSGPGALFGASFSIARFTCILVMLRFVGTGSG